MKLNNSILVGIGFLMLIAGAIALCIFCSQGWELFEHGRREEMGVWPVAVAYGICLFGFSICMHFGFKEINNQGETS